MSEVEAKRIMKEIPDITNPPSVFNARLKMTRKNRQVLLEKRKKQIGQDAVDVTTMSIEDLEKIVNQGN